MSAFDDFMQDVESSFTGGMSSDEERIQGEREAGVAAGFGEAGGAIDRQYFGPNQGDIEKAARLRQFLETAGSMFPPGYLVPEDFAAARRELALVEGRIQEQTEYSPSYYAPTTDYDVAGYDVEGYDPTKVKHQSEAAWAALNPDKFDVPEYEAAALQGPSEAAKAKADVQGTAAQRGALGAVEDVYKQGGLTAIDRERLEQIRRKNQMQARAAREAIVAERERRGQGGSGTEFAALLAAQEGAATRGQIESLGVSAEAQRRAMEAMTLAGGMGRDLATDVYGREFETGAEEDKISRFNTEGAREVQADTRTAQDEKVGWDRDVLERDVNRITEADVYNADAQTGADKWTAEQGTEANKWLAGEQIGEAKYGADMTNAGAIYNAEQETLANKERADRAWGSIGGINTQLAGQAGLTLDEAAALDAIKAGQPTPDWGQFVGNVTEAGKAVMEFATDPANDKEMILTGDGGGGAAGGTGGGGSGGGALSKALAFMG